MKRRSSETVKIRKTNTSAESVSRKFLVKDLKMLLSRSPKGVENLFSDPPLPSWTGPYFNPVTAPKGFAKALRLQARSRPPSATEKQKGSQGPRNGAIIPARPSCSPAREMR